MDFSKLSKNTEGKIESIADKLCENKKVGKALDKVGNAKLLQKIPVRKLQMIISAIGFLSFLLPMYFLSSESSVSCDLFSFSDTETQSISGFRMIGESYFTVLLIVMTLTGIAAFFVPKLKELQNAAFWGEGLLGIAFTIISAIIYAIKISLSGNSYVDLSVYPHIGFFILLFVFFAVLLFQLLLVYSAKNDKKAAETASAQPEQANPSSEPAEPTSPEQADKDI